MTIKDRELRDQFAAQVLRVAYERRCERNKDQILVYKNWREEVALECYQMADAMMRVREYGPFNGNEHENGKFISELGAGLV